MPHTPTQTHTHDNVRYLGKIQKKKKMSTTLFQWWHNPSKRTATITLYKSLIICICIHTRIYVIYQYTDRKYKNINHLTVAPDTHVIQATRRLGLITNEELNKNDVQLIVVNRWDELFRETKYNPIDIHTPLWLWSRNGFKEVK